MIREVCKCGCGGIPKKRKSHFLPGHNNATPERRKQISKARQGAGNPFFGKKHSTAFKKALSQRNSGSGNPMYGSCRTGGDSPNWRGGRRVTDDGYIAIRLLKDYVLEHHLIAERVLGRPLKFLAPHHSDNEMAHHINFDRADNRERNLVICTISYHNNLHHRIRQQGLVTYFKELVA